MDARGQSEREETAQGWSRCLSKESLLDTPIRMIDSKARGGGAWGRVGPEFEATGKPQDKLLPSLSLELFIEE